MVSLHWLVLFVSALAVVYSLPGPDMALVLQTSASQGARAGFAAASGLALARATHVTLSACGVAALLRSAPWMYDGVRIVGGAYLAYLAFRLVRARSLLPEPAATGHAGSLPGSTGGALRHAFAKGCLTSLLNPKALLFCSVLLPQFVERGGPASVIAQVIELGAVLVAVGCCFDTAYVLGAARLAGWLRRHPRAQTVQRWAFASALFAFAVRLSLD